MKDRKCFSDQMNRNRSLTLLKQKDIMLNSMTQTGEKWDSLVLGRGDFWMIWTCHAILCFYFIFMFRNVVREQLGQNNFSGCYVFFSKVTFRKYLITTMFKVLYQQLWSTLIDNGIWKDTWQRKILWTPVSSLPQYIQLIIACFSFSQTSLVFKFNLLLNNFCHNLFTFLSFDIYLEVHPVPLRFFHKSQ